MATQVKAIPEGFHAVTPSLTLKNSLEAIEFYKRAFGATEKFVMTGPDGKMIMHAELRVGDCVIMLGQEMPGSHCKAVETLHGSPVNFCIYVPNVETEFKRAIEAGAKEMEPLKEQFWGDRMGTVSDPFGFQWSLATRIEDLSENEIRERAKIFFAQKGA